MGAATLDWLADYRFTGNIFGYREGEAYFPGSPMLVVDGTFAEAVILETLVLSVLNYDCAVASAATRMVSAAEGRPLMEMGSRRAHEHAAVAAARAAFIAGFGATSNLEAGRSWGIPTMGTAAHAFTLLHDSEEEAFRAQVDAFGPSTTLLVDTFDIEHGVELAVKVAGTVARGGAHRLRRPRRAGRGGAQAARLARREADPHNRHERPRRVLHRGPARGPGRLLRGRHFRRDRIRSSRRWTGLQARRPHRRGGRVGLGSQELGGEGDHRRPEDPRARGARRRGARGAHLHRGVGDDDAPVRRRSVPCSCRS